MGCVEAMRVVPSSSLMIGLMMMVASVASALPNYGDALYKSILFFEGQRSGKLPSYQRMKWRGDSALRDGQDRGVDLEGGYYDAGDNVKYNFPMAYTTTMLAWSVIQYGWKMGPELPHAYEAIRWGTDYLIKCTNRNDMLFVGVGDPWGDHKCWERPEDMDTPRTSISIDQHHPGSEVSAEMAAALAASSIAFKSRDQKYANFLLQRAFQVFNFANNFQGSYKDSVGSLVCPFYCDFNGYQDELVWAAAWLYKASGSQFYANYVKQNLQRLAVAGVLRNVDGQALMSNGGSFTEFGWDAKHAGIVVLLAQLGEPFVSYADGFVCSVLPESPTKAASYSPGGLMFKTGDANLQHATALGFLLLAYADYMRSAGRVVHCGGVAATADRLASVARSQVDYILGQNPSGMSYMVGYGQKFPQKIHHRGSVLPSIFKHPKRIDCGGGKPYFESKAPNANILTGAVVGGPYANDWFNDSRYDPGHTEPTTYINAPLVGMLAYFK